MPVQWQKDQKIDSPGHILVKALKAQNKERIAKAAMKKVKSLIKADQHLVTQQNPFKPQGPEKKTFKSGKVCVCQPKRLCPSKLSVNIEGIPKTLHEKDRLNWLKTAKSALQRILEKIIQSEKKGQKHPRGYSYK